MSLHGYALTAEHTTEIVSAYAASMQDVPAVASAPGWFVVGSFFLPISVKARLEVIASLSDAGLAGTGRLYDPSAGVDAPVPGSDVPITGTSLARFLSATFTLTGQRLYTLQVQVTGATGADKFGTVHTAALVSPA